MQCLFFGLIFAISSRSALAQPRAAPTLVSHPTVQLAQLCSDLGVHCEVDGAATSELMEILNRTREADALPTAILEHVHACGAVRDRNCAEFSPLRHAIQSIHFVPSAATRAMHLNSGARVIVDCRGTAHLYLRSERGNPNRQARSFKRLLSRLMSVSWQTSIDQARHLDLTRLRGMPQSISLEFSFSNPPTNPPAWIGSGSYSIFGVPRSPTDVSASFGPLAGINPTYLTPECWGGPRQSATSTLRPERSVVERTLAEYESLVRTCEYFNQICGNSLVYYAGSNISIGLAPDATPPTPACEANFTSSFDRLNAFNDSVDSLSHLDRARFHRAKSAILRDRGEQNAAIVEALSEEYAGSSEERHLSTVDIAALRERISAAHTPRVHADPWRERLEQLLQNQWIRQDLGIGTAP